MLHFVFVIVHSPNLSNSQCLKDFPPIYGFIVLSTFRFTPFIFKKRESYKSSVDEVKNSQSKLAELNQIIAKKEESFSAWIELNREHVSELKEEACKITKTVSRTLKSVSVLVEKGHEEKSAPVCTSNITVSGDKKENIEGEDSPNEVYVKANEAMMSQEGIARMEKEAEVQIKELLNKKK